jgi:TonB family protein
VVKNPKPPTVMQPKFVKGGSLTGYRDRASVMRGIMANLGRLRKLFDEFYDPKSVTNLKVVANFKIDHLGNVISSSILESNSNNSSFDMEILTVVNSIKFESIEHIGDTSIIVYPFIFSSP